MAAAGGTKSSLSETLVNYQGLLKAAADQKASGKTATDGSPFFDANYLWGRRASIDRDSHYSLGWVVTKLPGQGGLVGVNSYESPGGLPTIAKGIPKSVDLVYYNGAMEGALSAICLLPETEMEIVILSNTFALCDAPDWIAQLLVEVILDSPENGRTEFIDVAEKASTNSLSHHGETRRTLEEERVPGTKHRGLVEYSGRYYNSIGNFFIDVAVHGDGLRMTIQGYPFVSHDLHHYHYDVFAWGCDRDAETRRAIYPQWSPDFHRISFIEGDGKIRKLRWGF